MKTANDKKQSNAARVSDHPSGNNSSGAILSGTPPPALPADATTAKSPQLAKPSGWTRAEIAATIISCLALMVSIWSVWLQRAAMESVHKLVLKADITRSAAYDRNSLAMVLSPVDAAHQVQSVRITSPKYGYDENPEDTTSSPSSFVDYGTVLSRAARFVEESCPSTPPPDKWWACRDSLPVVMEAEYIAGGKLRVHRGLYAIHFTDLVISKDRPTEPLEMTFVSYVRDLSEQEQASAVADAELSRRQFKWEK